MITVLITVLITADVLYLAVRAGHAHANYRPGRARGHRASASGSASSNDRPTTTTRT